MVEESEMPECNASTDEPRKQVKETFEKVQKVRKQSRQSLWWSVTALIVIIVAGVIQIAVKVL